MIEINRHLLNVEVQGEESGIPVVLLHHGLGTTHSWKNQVPVLVENGFRVIVYDRWGYGQSQARSDTDIPFFTKDLEDLLTLCEVLALGSACFIGHSDGATIALLFAIAHPQKVTSLVTVGAHIYIDERMRSGIRQVCRRYENDLSFKRALARHHGDKVDRVFYNWYDGWSHPENQNWDLRPSLHFIECPTLVIQGEHDEHATQKQAIDLAKAIKHSELWLVEGAYHMIPQDQPSIFNQRVIPFLAASSAVKQPTGV